jgi:hypothetical protein
MLLIMEIGDSRLQTALLFHRLEVRVGRAKVDIAQMCRSDHPVPGTLPELWVYPAF